MNLQKEGGKRIAPNADSFKIPVKNPEGEDIELTFHRIPIKWHFEDSTGKLGLIRHKFQSLEKPYRYYLNHTGPSAMIRLLKNMYEQNKELFDKNPEYLDLPTGKLLRVLQAKHKWDLTDKSKLGMHKHGVDPVLAFEIDKTKMGKGRGLYIWSRNNEMNYVGIANNFNSRHKEYENPGASVAIGAGQVYRINSYIQQALAKVGNSEEADNIIKLYATSLDDILTKPGKSELEFYESQVIQYMDSRIEKGKDSVNSRKWNIKA